MKNIKSNIVLPVALVALITLVLFILSLLGKNSDFFAFCGDSSREIQADLANTLIRDTTNFKMEPIK